MPKFKYYIYGDLTGFFDRWGTKHTRLIGVTNSRISAYIQTRRWVHLHSHGSAFASRTRFNARQLGYFG